MKQDARKQSLKLDMCLQNTDAPVGNKVKIFKFRCFDPTQPPGAFDASEMWATHRWTYSLSLVTVSSAEL